MTSRLLLVCGVVALAVASIPAAYYSRGPGQPAPTPEATVIAANGVQPSGRRANVSKPEPQRARPERQLEMPRLECSRRHDSVICARQVVCFSEANCTEKLSSILAVLSKGASAIQRFCAAMQPKVAEMERQIGALEERFANLEELEQRVSGFEKDLVLDHGEGDREKSLLTTVTGLCGLSASLVGAKDNSSAVLRQIEALFGSIPKNEDGVPAWPERNAPSAPPPAPPSAAVPPQTRFPAPATERAPTRSPPLARVPARSPASMRWWEGVREMHFDLEVASKHEIYRVPMDVRYEQALAEIAEVWRQAAAMSQAYATAQAICTGQTPAAPASPRLARFRSGRRLSLAELCARLKAFELNIGCLHEMVARLGLLQKRLEAVREREARWNSLMERWTRLQTLAGAHEGTRESGGEDGTKQRLLDLAIACYEQAYAVRRCDPSFITDYGAQNCKRELAMIGVRHAFTGARQEAGDHLMWSFAAKAAQGQPALPMADSYNLFVRKAGETEWTKLNSSPIKPASTWVGSSVGGLDSPAAANRLPSVWHTKYIGTNASQFNNFLNLLSLPPYQKVYFAEGYKDQSGNPAVITNKTVRDNYVASQGRPVPTTAMEPLPLLLTLSQSGNPWLSRLMGLSWFSPNTLDGTPRDYLLMGIWQGDRIRFYHLRGLSEQTTRPVPAPVLSKADIVPMPVMKLPGGPTRYVEAAVNLSIVPPTPAPSDPLLDPFDIRPVVYKFRRSDRGSSHVVAQSTGAYSSVQRPDGHGGLTDAAPVALIPEKNSAGALVWGPVYRDLNVGYRHYRYVTVGVDPFLRESAPSNELSASVLDTAGPMSPPRFTARVFQRGDKTPIAAKVDPAWFNGANPPQFVIQFEFDWPNALDEITDDLAEYRFFYRFDDPDTFAQPGGLANVSNWDGWSAATDPKFKVPKISNCNTVPASSHYSCKPYTDATGTVLGKRYSFVTFVPAGSSDLITASLRSQLSANNDEPYKVIYFAMASVDQPAANIGPLTGPVPAQVMNLNAPPAPNQPVFVAQSSSVNSDGNVAVTVKVDGADLAHTYNIYRISDAELNNVTPQQSLPATCNAETDGAVRQVSQERAQGNLEKLTKANSEPIKPTQQGTNVQVMFVDQVDGTRTQHWFYAAAATNRPGNEGPHSCASLAMLVRAMMPPPKVVMTAIHADDERIQVEWNKVFRPDLKRYEVYATAHAEFLNRPRKMRLVAVVDKDGLAVMGGPNREDAEVVTRGNASACPANSPTTTPPCVPYVSDWLAFTDRGLKPGVEYHYQIRAVNEQGVPSPLSESVSASPFDETPPLAPFWDPSDPLVDTKGSGAGRTITLKWSLVPGDADAKFLVQRRATSFPAWVPVGGWLAAGTVALLDDNIAATETYEYRIQAMDPFGNRGPWSSSIFSE